MGTGYHGRIALFEILVVDDEIRELVVQRSDAATIRQLAVKKRMVTLREDGKQKVIQGITTTQELLRVTGEDIL